MSFSEILNQFLLLIHDPFILIFFFQTLTDLREENNKMKVRLYFKTLIRILAQNVNLFCLIKIITMTQKV